MRSADFMAMVPVEIREAMARRYGTGCFRRRTACVESRRPRCNLELRTLQKTLPEMTKLGVQLVAISPQTPDESLSTAEKNELAFAALSDVGSATAKAFGIAFDLAEELRPTCARFGHALPDKNGDESWVLPIPATYVIDRLSQSLRARGHYCGPTGDRKRIEGIVMTKFIAVTGASKGIGRGSRLAKDLVAHGHVLGIVNNVGLARQRAASAATHSGSIACHEDHH